MCVCVCVCRNRWVRWQMYVQHASLKVKLNTTRTITRALSSVIDSCRCWQNFANAWLPRCHAVRLHVATLSHCHIGTVITCVCGSMCGCVARYALTGFSNCLINYTSLRIHHYIPAKEGATIVHTWWVTFAY